MGDTEQSRFSERLEVALAEAGRRERLSSRFLTVCLLATAAATGLWIFTRGDVYVSDTYFVAGPRPGFAIPGWMDVLLPWFIVLCYGVLGAATLLHFTVFRRRAQQLRRQRSQALLIELEDALEHRARLRSGN